MGSKHIKTPSNLKEVGLQEVQIPERIKQAINDITVLMYHINQVETEYNIIMYRHRDLISEVMDDDDFGLSINDLLSKCSCLYGSIVEENMTTDKINNYLCSDGQEGRK